MNKEESFIANFKHKKRNIKEHLEFKSRCIIIPIIIAVLPLIKYVIPMAANLIIKCIKIFYENDVVIGIFYSLLIAFIVWGFVEYRTLIFDIKEKVIYERDNIRVFIINIEDNYPKDKNAYTKFLLDFQTKLLNAKYSK